MTEIPRPYSFVLQSDFASQYRHVFEAAECKTQAELAAVLDIRQSSISDAKRRESIPSDWLIKLLEKKRINPEWVRSGMGKRAFQPSDGEANRSSIVVTTIKRRPAQECTVEELITEIVRRVLKTLE